MRWEKPCTLVRGEVTTDEAEEAMKKAKEAEKKIRGD